MLSVKVPPADCEGMDIDVLSRQSRWEIRGDWFPFEVLVKEFVFVVDDDGKT
jgi:hypothetical protein